MKKEYSMACSPLLREFFGYLEVVKGRSAGTVNEYFVDLRAFFRYVKREKGYAPSSLPDAEIAIDDVDMDLIRQITLLDVYEYFAHTKNDRGNTSTTRARKTTSLRVFFKYLTDISHRLEVNPIQGLDTPKTKKALPKYLTLEQSMELLNSVSGDFALRDYCMLTLFLNCGLRRAELAGINLSDISSDRTLRVVGKGNKERILYLNDACWNAINAYLEVRPRDGVRDRDALFLSARRQRITLQGVHYVVKRYLGRVPGAENLSTHKLRHTAATLMYQQGGTDIRVLKDILGHENLGTTEIYTHLSTKQIREAAENNPLSSVKPPKPKHAEEKSKQDEVEA